MELRYIYQRGKKHRKMHILPYDRWGNEVWRALCGRNDTYDSTINAPFSLGRGVCKDCKRILNERGLVL